MNLEEIKYSWLLPLGTYFENLLDKNFRNFSVFSFTSSGFYSKVPNIRLILAEKIASGKFYITFRYTATKAALDALGRKIEFYT